MGHTLPFSLIICTYNPQAQLFSRVIASCLAQLKNNSSTELLIIDNNSVPPLSAPVTPDDALYPRVKLHRETKQGHVYARLRGFYESRGEVLVFVDDDNVLADNYLAELEQVLLRFPEVGVWGPGNITPEYLGTAPAWIKHFGGMFQQKTTTTVQKGNEKGWPAYYPSGSGMAVKRAVMEKFNAAISSKQLQLEGRKGDALSSGEDAQIVWTAIKEGYQAGIAPGMKLLHLIPPKRQQLNYLLRLQKELGYSYCKGLAEVFPEKKTSLKPLSLPGHIKLLLKTLQQNKLKPLLFWRKYKLELAWFKGVKKALR